METQALYHLGIFAQQLQTSFAAQLTFIFLISLRISWED